MLLSTAIEKFLKYADGNVYSPKYIRTVKSHLNRVKGYFGDRQFEALTLDDWLSYLNYLRSEYVPKRKNGNEDPISQTTIHHYVKTIRRFYSWANDIENIPVPRIDIKLPRTRYQSPQEIPFSKKEIQMLLDALNYSKVEKKNGQNYVIRRKYPERNKAILLVLLDTGMRCGELSRLRPDDVNLENREIYIRPYRDGRKSRARVVYLGTKAAQALKKYIDKFRSHAGRTVFGLNVTAIRFLIRRLGENAGVINAHPHRFRHTFAINYLRNFGSTFTLQRILGHTTPDMSLKYLHLSQSDAADQHRRASPVDNWKL